ncbi:MAG: HD domain-containing protein [Candidatus Binataceae bacterium]|nr:HD domain-containing protein [Candidatus Binataceae bacterium]
MIVFERDSELDQLAWRLLNGREFQRLRRIKQLGFSELTFPGATHTRFSHCIGVFHNARRLIQILKKKARESNFDKQKARNAIIAALLHDLGHGPFSHTFEGVQKALGQKIDHEAWTVRMLSGQTGQTEIRGILESFDRSLPSEIAEIIGRANPANMYDTIVSSQFDADRLDYLQRDRYMSGIGTGQFDFNWLLDCLEVGDVTVGIPGEDDLATVPTLYLSYKALQSAEGYLLARYHLYSQVYLHKTTRAAERMLAALLFRVGTVVRQDELGRSGLASRSKLAQFFEKTPPTLETYLDLDDSTLWAAITEMSDADDPQISIIAQRLRDRKLYKCCDVSALATRSDSLLRFRKKLTEEFREVLNTEVLTDEVPLSAYGIHDYEEPGALQQVLIGRADGSKDDIAKVSSIIASITKPQKIFRVYADDNNKLNRIQALLRECSDGRM